jgi:hypothetical protein
MGSAIFFSSLLFLFIPNSRCSRRVFAAWTRRESPVVYNRERQPHNQLRLRMAIRIHLGHTPLPLSCYTTLFRLDKFAPQCTRRRNFALLARVVRAAGRRQSAEGELAPSCSEYAYAYPKNPPQINVAWSLDSPLDSRHRSSRGLRRANDLSRVYEVSLQT